MVNSGTVPDLVDGQEVTVDSVPFREMEGEWNQWGRNIFSDTAYNRDMTILMKYDAREAPNTVIEPQYKITGGNVFAWIHRAGSGKVSFFPPGHDNSELYSTDHYSFDAGTGDLERYLAQLFYFLAGYDTVPCDSSCDGLQIVSDDDQLTGDVYDAAVHTGKTRPFLNRFPEIRFSSSILYITAKGSYTIELINLMGEQVFSHRAESSAVFDLSGYQSGVYLVKVTSDSGSAVTRKILLY